MKKIPFIFTLLFLAAITLTPVACKKKENGSNYNPTYLKLNTPVGWSSPTFDIFSGNPLTEEGFQLGRKLFYDGRLSKDGAFPCSSCHEQNTAFATYDHALSHGYNNSYTTRNAPGLFNLAWKKELHWDGAYTQLAPVAVPHITAINEMSETMDNVINKIKSDTSYIRLFSAAFGDRNMTADRILKALAQFSGSIISANSKYDKVKRGEASFNLSEQSGYNLFKAKCSSCHPEPLFTDFSYRNIGLNLDPTLKDIGRQRVTGNAADSLKFMVPSLRNADLSFPYMHDGRIYSLPQVLEFYRLGINVSQPTLDPLLRSRIALTNTEISDLISFIQALNDTELTTNPRFQQP